MFLLLLQFRLVETYFFVCLTGQSKLINKLLLLLYYHLETSLKMEFSNDNFTIAKFSFSQGAISPIILFEESHSGLVYQFQKWLNSYLNGQDMVFIIILTMNMFLECPIPLFIRDLSEIQQSVSNEKSEVNCTTWNAFGLEEPEFVDCNEYRDRKSTGLEIEEGWEDSLLISPSFPKESIQEAPTGKSSHKNQTKNIPKNYGKATILYIRSNKSRVNKLLHMLCLDESEFNDFINYSRCHINTIKEIRNFWTHEKFGKAVRILSFEFMRKHSLKYIFNSRIKNHITHVKYRNKLMSGLKNPELFTNIKDF